MPTINGSNHFCYLKKNLMVIVSADHKFICVDMEVTTKIVMGAYLKILIWDRDLKLHNLINVPDDKNLPGQNEPCPHVWVGDEALALKPHLMNLFHISSPEQTDGKRILIVVYAKLEELLS
nr:unnamed protein product [Callosobruchus analis]